MLEEKIRYVPVWPAAVRAVHWLLAAGVAFQLASGWLAGRLADGTAFWRDWHLMVGQGTLLVLLVRVILLFRPGSGGWRAFVPTSSSLEGARRTLISYATLGRAPLPAWYAHNPLWQLVYPVMGLAVLVAAVSGLMHDAPYLVAGAGPDVIHGVVASVVAALAAAHVVTVVLHDLRGRGAFVSAMINGYRYFHVSGPPGAVRVPGQGQSVEVLLDPARQPKDPSSGRE